MTFLSAPVRMHGFPYSHASVPVSFQLGVIAENGNTILMGGMTAGRSVLNNGVMVLLLEGYHRPEMMR